MARQSVELISPTSVYHRFLGGPAVAAVGFYLYAEIGPWLALLGLGLVLVTIIQVRNPRLVLRYARNRRRTVMELIENWRPQPGRAESEL